MQFDVPARISHAEPDAVRASQIRQRLVKSVEPVRSLPSSAAMTVMAVVTFVFFAFCLAAPVGFYGLMRMSAGQAAIVYPVVLLLAFVIASGVVQQMIPGSRRVMSPGAGALLAILLLSVNAMLLFPDFDTQNFVHRGFPCLRLGLLCAIPGAGATWAMMRRGFVLEPVQAAISGGALSGLLGLAVLALHCPIFTAAHIIGWHVAVLALTSLAGALAGWALSRIGQV